AGLLALCCSSQFHSSWFHAGVVLEGVGAIVVVGAVFQSPNSARLAVLDWRITRFFGRISYSFYLLHAPILFVAAALTLQTWPVVLLAGHPFLGAGFLALLSVSASVPLASAMYRWVELPGIHLGRTLCRSSAWLYRETARG
ncbi:MAG: hypothetical protein ABI680_15080, partial [Chthoniobacteraceae bacterium]